MSSLHISKRLIGKQDVNWDITGNDEKANFVTSDGVTKDLDKINAAHIPLRAATRANLGEKSNVDDALSFLNTKITSIGSVSAMASDLEIIFEANATILEIQGLIDQQIKNLGGYTLTFQFPEYINQSLTTSLKFKGFQNGTLIISCGENVTILDALNIETLLRFSDCTCEVKIQGMTFQHTYSKYAIYAERSASINVNECSFTGNADSTTYALALVQSNGSIDNCTFDDDLEIDVKNDIIKNVNKEIEDLSNNIATLSDNINGLNENKANISDIQEIAKNRVWISEKFTLVKNTPFQFTHNLNLSEEDLNRARAEVLFYWENDTEIYGYNKGDLIRNCAMIAYLTGNTSVTEQVSNPTVEISQNSVLFPFYHHVIFCRKDNLNEFVSTSNSATNLARISAKIRIFY